MEAVSDLQYLFDKYIASTSKGKPSPRDFKNLMLALSVNEIFLITSKSTTPPNN